MTQPDQRVEEAVIRECDGLLKAEPADLRALAWRGSGFGIVALEQVTQIKMQMTAGWMDVEVEERRRGRTVAKRQSRLLARLAQGRRLGRFIRLDMTTWLQPYPEPLVEVEHRPSPAKDNCRRRHVHPIRISVQGSAQARELGEEAPL